MRMIRRGVLHSVCQKFAVWPSIAFSAEPSSLDAFLAVHIGNRPAVVADGVAVGVEQIQFGHGGVRLAVVGVQGFEAEKSVRWPARRI